SIAVVICGVGDSDPQGILSQLRAIDREDICLQWTVRSVDPSLCARKRVKIQGDRGQQAPVFQGLDRQPASRRSVLPHVGSAMCAATQRIHESILLNTVLWLAQVMRRK